ncbi:MAG: heme A synthase [Boseongicola sp. SB0675_bin_26]|nr:heme A synthase [Boseongicola sp. SB0675_bin_26]
MSTKRSIFEEVGEGAERVAVPAGGAIGGTSKGARGAIRLWLSALGVLVVLIVVVGGMTRLTDSGLSITEWRPVAGAIPPMSVEAWEAEFKKYRQIPEYRLQNEGMTLAEFKTIYWWEWGHRQLGRITGLVWAAGFLFFLAARRIPAGWTGRLLLPGILGGAQGVIGWWMVSSGLSGDTLDVASYRLAVHLGLAFVILGIIAWQVMLLGRSDVGLLQARRARDARLLSSATGLMHLAFLQILLGALVAGIDAGRTFNDWPGMAGQFFPPAAFDLEPLWWNFMENAGLVQFMHRIAGYLLLALGIAFWLRARRSGNRATRGAFTSVLAMLVLQLLLGIMTVLYVAPPGLAVLHQLGAVLLFLLILRARFLASYPLDQSVRDAA